MSSATIKLGVKLAGSWRDRAGSLCDWSRASVGLGNSISRLNVVGVP